MRSQLVPISTLPPIAIAKAHNQTPLKSSSITISSSPLPFHTLSERTHIPSHVYRHPAAVLLELCTSMKELHQILPLVIKNGLYNEHLFQTKLVSLFSKYGSINEAARVFEPIEGKLDALYHTMLKGFVAITRI